MQAESTTRTIPLSQGLVALVDAEDYDALATRSWYAMKRRHTFYACHSSGSWRHGTSVRLRMHQIIMGTKYGEQVDHINGNGLDNRRSNLRLVVKSRQNQQNHRLNQRSTSGFTGVSFVPSRGKWQSYISEGGKRYPLGRFSTAEEAARVRDLAAMRLHGEFARLNFPQDRDTFKST